MFFLKPEKRELVLILDIQSSVVRGSLALLLPSASPHIIFSYNVPIAWKTRTDSTYLIKTTLKAVAECVEAALRFIQVNTKLNIPKRIGTMHLVLSSPWILSEAKVITESFNSPVTITKNHINHLIEEDRKKLEKSSGSEVTIIEQKIFSVFLNGYETALWDNQVSKELKIAYAMSAVGTKMMDRFVEACQTHKHRFKIRFHSSLLLQQVGIKTIDPNLDNYALLHIHGELTEIAMIDHGSCSFFGSFPFGVRTLVRKIASSKNCDFQSADSMLTLYTGGHYDKVHAETSMERIRNISIGWTSELARTLQGNKDEGRAILMPRKMLLSALSHDDFFSQILNNVYPKSKIELINIENISPKVFFDSKSERRRLTGLYAIAIHIMGNQ